MTTVVIVIHLMVVVAMIGLILLQRSEGGALGIGGGQGAFMTGRSAGNVLSHTTAYLAIAFFVTSLGLAFIAKYQSRPADILERLPGQTAPVTETPAAPAPTVQHRRAPRICSSSSAAPLGRRRRLPRMTLPHRLPAAPQPRLPLRRHLLRRLHRRLLLQRPRHRQRQVGGTPSPAPATGQ